MVVGETHHVRKPPYVALLVIYPGTIRKKNHHLKQIQGGGLSMVFGDITKEGSVPNRWLGKKKLI